MAEIRKSLWLDKPSKQPAVVRQSQTFEGTLVSAHPEAGYAVVDVGGNLVNVRMDGSSIGWDGAPVTVTTTPDAMPQSASVTSGVVPPKEAPKYGFGASAQAILENERAFVGVRSDLDTAKQQLDDARARLAEAEAAISESAETTPKALQALKEAQESARQALDTYTQQSTKRIDALKAETAEAVATANRAVEQAQSAVQSAAQAAGIADGKGETIISRSEPDVSKRKTNNLWIGPGKTAGTIQTYIWDEATSQWIPVDDDSIQQAAQNALDAMGKASAAEDAARRARTEAANAKLAAATAQSTAVEAQSTADNAMSEAKNAPRVAVGHSYSYARGRLQPPYRDGDMLIIGDGSPVKVSETWVYESGAWKRHLFTVDNLVVNQAMWAKLIQADTGELGTLIVNDKAMAKDLFVTNQAALKDVIVTGNANIAQAVLGKLTAEQINALNIKASAVDVGPRMKIDVHGVRVFDGPADEETSNVVTQLTGEDQSLGIMKNGQVVAGFNSDGDMSAQDATVSGTLTTKDLLVSGVNLMDRLDENMARVIARVAGTLNYKSLGADHAANAWCKIGELIFTNDDTERHAYGLITSGVPMKALTGGMNHLYLRATIEVKEGGNPSTPEKDSPVVDSRVQAVTGAGWATLSLSSSMTLDPGVTGRVGIWTYSTSRYNFWSIPFLAHIVDYGRDMAVPGNGRMSGWSTDLGYSSQPPAEPVVEKRRYTREWTASSSATYSQNSGTLVNGWYRNSGKRWVGRSPSDARDGAMKSKFWFPSDMTSTVRGAEVEQVLVYVEVGHSYGSNLNLRVYPASPSGGWSRYGELTTTSIGKYQGRWIDVTSAFRSHLQAGNLGAIAFDPDGNTSTAYYGHVLNVRLKVTYKK